VYTVLFTNSRSTLLDVLVLFAEFDPASGLNTALVLEDLQTVGNAAIKYMNAHSLIAPVDLVISDSTDAICKNLRELITEGYGAAVAAYSQ